ncbi:MAG: hypothetical protein SGILL_006106 [Bacillariaceae sp.]
MVTRAVAGLVSALSLVQPSRALTTHSTGLVWSEGAIQLVKSLSVSEREKLLAEDDDFLAQKPMRITAERVTHESPSMGDGKTRIPSDNGSTITKIVHFQRHGQGYHNLLGDILRDAGIKPNIDSKDPTINPWIRPEIVDSPLTETGKWQCEQQRSLASNLDPELVVAVDPQKATDFRKG